MAEAEELGGHDDGIISLAFADNMLYSGSYDHSIRSWDVKEMMQRISERNSMSFEDV
jgi:F-box and WD-40 domain protein 1/11/F-box/WD-40 domain protein 7